LSQPADSSAAGAGVRALAARLNTRVVAEGQSLAALGDDASAGLPERDRPLLKALLMATLRWHHRLDWQLGQLLERPLKREDALLGALLRVGLAQIQDLRIPDHAAVSATVNASRELGLERASGLVNAVLRRYLRERGALGERALGSPVARYSHPPWLIAALERDWPDRWREILDRGNELPPFWLRVNRRRIGREAYRELLGAAGMSATPDAHAIDALLLAEACPVDELPGFAAGLVSVQDVAAQRAADLLDLAPGCRVLDACAAPGGKTAHILERCPGLTEVVAVDSDTTRLETVAENLGRLGLAASIVAGDAGEPAGWWDGRPFDRILVDAPCSATGVIRRHPDIKLLRRAGDIEGLAAGQRRMLEALWPLLDQGGRLVYATCSVLRAENQGVAGAFAAARPDASLPPFGSPEHFQLFPGEANGDGFYYACLKKCADRDN
jgi:16S rRNA (cytosine967-C5)-methyltransferase